jgi:hypothetical protein
LLTAAAAALPRCIRHGTCSARAHRVNKAGEWGDGGDRVSVAALLLPFL